MLSLYGPPIVFALFVWWFSTGVILILNKLPRRTFPWSMAGASVVLALCFYGLAATAARPSVPGAYVAFTCGLLAWGWQELSFFTGFITGPRPLPCPPDCTGWARFRRAVAASIYHELASLAAAVAIVALTWGGDNQVGTWTYVALWTLRLSAKFNVFLGARNLNEQFLPDHLSFVRSYLTHKRMNPLFPLSLAACTVSAILLARAAAGASGDTVAATGLAMLATIVALGAVEHGMLMLPLPFAALWNWSVRPRGARPLPARRADAVRL